MYISHCCGQLTRNTLVKINNDRQDSQNKTKKPISRMRWVEPHKTLKKRLPNYSIRPARLYYRGSDWNGYNVGKAGTDGCLSWTYWDFRS